MPFMYPTSAELRSIEPELVIRGRAGRLGLDLMPVRGVNAAKVRWTQKDNYAGLQQLRGLDGAPLHVNRVGQKTYEYEPGVFGEFVDITETELTIRAGSVDVISTPIDVQDLVVEAKSYLIGREFDRIESSIFTLLTTGVLQITLDGPNGTQIAYRDAYTFQTYTAPIAWATVATAVPIQNFQSVAQLGLGKGVNLGLGAVAYMNSVTANRMLNNANANDLGGRRVGGGSSMNSLADVNSYWVAQGLPKIVIYDEGYSPRLGDPWQKYIPDGTVIVIGKRPSGAVLGEYIMTRNASAQYRPVSYDYVIDRANGNNISEKRTPANIEIHRGHNGGPAFYFPSSVVVMTV